MLRNSLFIMATTIVNSILGYAFWLVAARRFAAPTVGLAAGSISAMIVAVSVSNLGVAATLIQILPQRRDDHDWSLTLTAGLTASGAIALLAGIVAVLLLSLLSPSYAVLHENIAYGLTFLGGVVFLTLGNILDSAFIAERTAGGVLARNSAVSGLKLLFLFLPAMATLRALGVTAAWVTAAGIALVIGFGVLVPRLGRRFRPRLRGLARETRSMIPRLVGNNFIGLGGLIPVFVLPILVTARLSLADTAYFYTTWMLGSVFFMVSPSVSASLFAEGAHATDEVYAYARRSALITGTFLLPLMIAFLAGDRLILSFFGPGYPSKGSGLLAILVASAIPDAVTNIYISVLRVEDRLRTAGILNLGMAAGTLLLAWFLLPRYGIVGGGLSWLLMQCAGSVFVGIDLLRHGLRLRSQEREPLAEFAKPPGPGPV